MAEFNESGPGPEDLASPELSPDEIAEIEQVVEMSEMILLADDDLVRPDAEEFLGASDFEEFAITPAMPSDPDLDRLHWTESEWPHVVRVLSEQFGLTEQTILDAKPSEGDRIALAGKGSEAGRIELVIGCSSDELLDSEVPYIPYLRKA